MVLFMDTNVLIDFLADRRPFSLSAGKLFTLALNKKVKIFISAISYNNIYYILKQHTTHKETIKLLTQLSDMTEVMKPAIVSMGLVGSIRLSTLTD